MKYSLRQANEEDIEWLDPFYEKIMRPYVELTHEWNANVFRAKYNPSNSQIIQIDGMDVGLFKKEVKDGSLFLWDIQLEENYRNRGIGSDLIALIKAEAKCLNLPIRLRVLKGNPADHFYRIHGFKVVEEMDNCFEMEWNANHSLEATATSAVPQL